MAQDLEAIKLQNEIEMLDREAAAAADQSLRADGSKGHPGGIFGLVFAIFFAFVCFAIAGSAAKFGAPALFAFVGIGMGIFAIVSALKSFLKSSEQAERQDNIRGRRDDLTKRLTELNKKPAA